MCKKGQRDANERWATRAATGVKAKPSWVQDGFGLLYHSDGAFQLTAKPAAVHTLGQHPFACKDDRPGVRPLPSTDRIVGRHLLVNA